MREPDSLHLKTLRHRAQSAEEIVAETNHVFDIENPREKHLHQIQKLRLLLRQIPPGEEPQQVPEVVPAVERHPLYLLVEHYSRSHEKIREPFGLDADSAVSIEVDPRAAEKLDGVRGVHVGPEVEFSEVELPDALPLVGSEGWEVSLVVG